MKRKECICIWESYIEFVDTDSDSRLSARPRESHEVQTADIAGKQGRSQLKIYTRTQSLSVLHTAWS